MDMSTINYLAVLAATLSTFLIGGIWYSPALFGKAWMSENKLSEEELKGGMVKIFVGSFILSFIMSLNLAMFLNDPSTDLVWGMMAGALAGIGWVAAGVWIIALFERKSFRYVAINGGYMVVAFIVMGLILGAWR